MNNEHHVVPNEVGGWDVKRSGAQRVSGHFNTKTEAITRARQLCSKAHSELVIHNMDGRISQKDSHGKDPHSVPG